MFYVIRTKLVEKNSLLLSEFTHRSTKKMVRKEGFKSLKWRDWLTIISFNLIISQAAQKFYSLLVLKKFQALQIEQEVPFGDILITRGDMFDNPKL